MGVWLTAPVRLGWIGSSKYPHSKICNGEVFLATGHTSYAKRTNPYVTKISSTLSERHPGLRRYRSRNIKIPWPFFFLSGHVI